jgi:hypothetical protein
MKMFQKLRTSLRRLYGSRLSPFPLTEQELNSFMLRVCDLGGWPCSDAYQAVIAQAILHRTQGAPGISATAVAKEIERSLANGLAYAVIADVKAREKAAKGDA